MRRSCHTVVNCRTPSSRAVPLAAGAALALLVARPAEGRPSDIAVRMSCPVLSDVAAAEFEARAKVDLAARSSRGGELEVTCEEDSVHLRWRQQGGVWRGRSMPRGAAPALLVDALLRVAEMLAEEAAVAERIPGENAPNDPGATPPSAGEPSDPARPEEEPRRSGERPGASRSLERAVGRDAAAKPDDASSPAPTTPGGGRGGGVSLGLGGAFFLSARTTGMQGASLAAFLELPQSFVFRLIGEYDLGLGAGTAVSVQMAAASAVVAKRFGPRKVFELGAGVILGGVFVTAEGPLTPASNSELFTGGVARTRYTVSSDKWHFSVGPELRFHAWRPEVAVFQSVVWALPVVSVGLGLEVSRTLFGSL